MGVAFPMKDSALSNSKTIRIGVNSKHIRTSSHKIILKIVKVSFRLGSHKCRGKHDLKVTPWGYKQQCQGTSLVVLMLRICLGNAKGAGLISGQVN